MTPTLRWFMLGMILANIAGNMFYSLLSVYLKELGASVEEIGLVFSLASVFMLGLQLAGGWLSDTLGRLRAVAIGSVVATAGYYLLAFADSWPVALGAICLEYVSGALVAPSFGAFVAEQSSEETRGRVFGIAESLFMIVGVVGPPLAGILAQNLGFRPMLLVGAFIYTSASLLRLWMARAFPARQSAEGEHLTFRNFSASLKSMLGLVLAGGLLTWVLITDGARDIAFRLSGELQPLYFKEIGGLNVEQIGWLGSLFGVAVMITMIPAGWLADRFGERVVIAGGFLFQFVGLAIFLFAADLLTFAVSHFVFGIGIGVMAPAYDALITKAIPEKMRGMGFALLWSSIGLISLPAPWLGAQLWAGISPRLPFLITAIVALLSVVPVWLKFRRPASSLPEPGGGGPANP